MKVGDVRAFKPKGGNGYYLLLEEVERGFRVLVLAADEELLYEDEETDGEVLEISRNWLETYTREFP